MWSVWGHACLLIVALVFSNAAYIFVWEGSLGDPLPAGSSDPGGSAADGQPELQETAEDVDARSRQSGGGREGGGD